ncbi:uncharacterized protein LOC131168220 isoform X2 [Malania oleifera]|uniref:uncharacterized protein LOC131168220 isoform X2 n=1 Tax=Malania oleifera TaxID=397392 RepID=UPI0025AEC080|nr:uncharacterized protein LOC131168220 isoform X2 [Malania oleifera]
MSEPRVTITLGRTGQVVKRPGTISDGVRADSRLLSGSKRSLRERLGNNVDSSLSLNKRHRGDGMKWSPSDHGRNDARVGRNDLRLKLMQRRLSRQTESDVEEHRRIERREKILRTDRPPMRFNMMQQMPERKEGTFFRRLPRTESADDLLLGQPMRKSSTLWTADGLRHRSPDRIFRTSRGLSPPRNVGQLRQMPSVRSIDASRSGRFLSNDVLNPSRSTGPAPITMKATSEYAKPIAQPMPMRGIVHKNSYMGEEPATVSGLLHSLGLEKYAISFQAEEVDMTALRQMGDKDLKELGIPMGPRKKILLALLPRSKRQPP